MVKNFLPVFRRTLLMLARRGIPLNLSIYTPTQNDIDIYKSWINKNEDDYNDKFELLNAYKRGVNITGYIPFFNMTDEEFDNLYISMRSDKKNWTYEYTIMKGEKGDIDIDNKNIYHSFLYNKGNNEFCFVYFADSTEQSIGNDIIKHCISSVNLMKEKSNIIINDIILILSKNLTVPAKKIISEINRGKPYNIEIFTLNDISIDPFDNVWNSEIKIYNKDESDKFLSDNNLMVSQLPRRPINDIQLKYLGCREGSIIEIKRYTYIPEALIRVELLHAYTYYKSEEKPRSVKKKQTSEIM